MDDKRINDGFKKILEGIAIVRKEHQAILDDSRTYRDSYLLRLNNMVNSLNSLELDIRSMP